MSLRKTPVSILLVASIALVFAGACAGSSKPGDGADTGGPSEGCRTAADCPSGGWTCEQGECKAPSGCQSDDDCVGNRECMAGQCLPPSAPDTGSEPDTKPPKRDTGDPDPMDVGIGDIGFGDADAEASDAGSGDAGSCSGCYASNDAGMRRCAPGTEEQACGSGGEACAICGAGEECKNGACKEKTCTPTDCPSGCCLNGQCLDGDTKMACGSGGTTCDQCTGDTECQGGKCVVPCGPNSCPGCCQNGTCKMGDTNSACGSGGSMCTSCAGDEKCSNGKCIKLSCQQRCKSMHGASGGCCFGTTCRPGTSDSACGSGGDSCNRCDNGFVCRNQSCELDLNSHWDVIAIDGEVPKSDQNNVFWDNRFNKPDPYVKVETKGRTKTHKGKTGTDDDDLTPFWNETTVQNAPAYDLDGFQNSTFTIMDADSVFGDDEIAKCKFDFDEAHFDGSFVTFNCTNHSGSSNPVKVEVTFRLRYHP